MGEAFELPQNCRRHRMRPSGTRDGELAIEPSAGTDGFRGGRLTRSQPNFVQAYRRSCLAGAGENRLFTSRRSGSAVIKKIGILVAGAKSSRQKPGRVVRQSEDRPRWLAAPRHSGRSNLLVPTTPVWLPRPATLIVVRSRRRVRSGCNARLHPTTRRATSPTRMHTDQRITYAPVTTSSDIDLGCSRKPL